MRRGHVCRFLVVLPNTDPSVWRRIQVPETYSFWASTLRFRTRWAGGEMPPRVIRIPLGF